MGLLIGLDEAGYGPNLGPLVITATLWETPGDPSDCDPYFLLRDAFSREAGKADTRLRVADSKAVYSSGQSIAPLERTVLTALSLLERRPGDFRSLCGSLIPKTASNLGTAIHDENCDLPDEPWFESDGVSLPLACRPQELDAPLASWKAATGQTRLVLKAIQSDIVFTPRFNHLTETWGNKSAVLSRLTLRLLRSIWNPSDPMPTLIIADKHGGRSRYVEYLTEIVDGACVMTTRESQDLSVYRVGATEIRFQTKAERHLPTALASMVSKYVREAAMTTFNEWWRQRVPGIRATQGYPVDARRFRSEIAAEQSRLGIADAVLWRAR